MAMDVVDYEIRGAEMQFVEVELDPGEAAIGEAGSMMFMDAGIAMDTVFGDGSAQQSGGLFGKLLGAGKRLVTGESLFTTVYSNTAHGKQRVAFAAPYPGQDPADGPAPARRHADLPEGRVPVRRARRVARHRVPAASLSVGFFGGEGFIMQKLDGDGLAFVHAGGTVLKRELQAGETLLVDTGCVVAYTPNVELRDPVRRQDQDGAVRRRGPVLRQGHRPGHGVAAEPAVLAPGVARVRRGAAARRLARGRLGARRPARGGAARRHPRRRRRVGRRNTAPGALRDVLELLFLRKAPALRHGGT